MKVSAIIPLHNYAQYLPCCIESLVNQTYKDFDITIIDDFSTDNSVDVSKQIRTKYENQIKINIVQLCENVGLSRVRDIGVRITNSEYFFFLDPDDKIANNYLELTVPLLDSHPNIGFVYPDTTYVYPNGKEYRFYQQEYSFWDLIQHNFVSYCNLIRRPAYFEAGGFDLNVRQWAEDWFMWIRMGRKGWYGLHLAEPLFFWSVHSGSAMQDDSFKKHFEAFRCYFITQCPEIYPREWVVQATELLKKYPKDFMSYNSAQMKDLKIQ